METQFSPSSLSLIAAGGIWVALRQSWAAVRARTEAQTAALDSARRAAEANERLIDAERGRRRELVEAVRAAREENAS